MKLLKMLAPNRVVVFPGHHDFDDFRLDHEGRPEQITSEFEIGNSQKMQLNFD
ncbi:MAG: hypothetical protein R8G34_20900 [Paracoccaceae bacterium]|nr:hypothetical protein [Paracoccaceae bacterium]